MVDSVVYFNETAVPLALFSDSVFKTTNYFIIKKNPMKKFFFSTNAIA